MKIIEQYSMLEGIQRKKIIIQALQRVVLETITDNNEIENINKIIEFTIPNFIDMIISIDKRDIVISSGKKCFPFIFSNCRCRTPV